MRNKREIYEALLAGHKLVSIISNITVFLNEDGNIVALSGENRDIAFSYPEEWQIVKPEKRKVKMAPVVIVYNAQDVIVSGKMFSSITEVKDAYKDRPDKVRWLIDTPYAIEVEID